MKPILSRTNRAIWRITCLKVLGAKGYETIWLGVWERNAAAIRFYEKLGFVKVGELQFPYGETVGTNYAMKMKL